jgi:hypothetical protein
MRIRGFVAAAILIASLALFAVGCKRKASPAECEVLLDRFATLVVKEKHPDAGAPLVESEQRRERDEAKHDEAFRNCPSEVSREELDCAMKAPTTEAMLKCLE